MWRYIVWECVSGAARAHTLRLFAGTAAAVGNNSRLPVRLKLAPASLSLINQLHVKGKLQLMSALIRELGLSAASHVQNTFYSL